MAGFESAALGAAAGAIAGSFIGVLFVRLPQGQPFVGGRSRCDHCGATLTAIDLLPILSFALLRGRCRHCGGAIAPELLAIEVAAALLGALAFALARVPAELCLALYAWTLLLLAALDIRHFWLPNRVTGVLAATGLAAVLLNDGDIVAALIGGAAGFAALELLRRGYRALAGRDGMGAGDPRLLGAIGLWTGWQALPFVVVGAAAFGLLMALAWRLGGADVGRATRVPLGAGLAFAAICVWLAAAAGVVGEYAFNFAAL